MDPVDLTSFEREFDQEIAKDDDGAARRRLAAGRSIHVVREDTPPGHVVRVHPDGREELVRVDPEAMAARLGR